MSDVEKNAAIYWPDGWNRERLLHADTTEIIGLPYVDGDRMLGIVFPSPLDKQTITPSSLE